MTKTAISNIFKMLRHDCYFEDLKVLQNAIDHKGEVSKDYFCEHFCYETWGNTWRSKDELKEIRQQLVDLIIQHIEKQNRRTYGRKMPADHYARYLHALAILKVDKSALHMTNNDHIRNAFLLLWQQDDGSKEARDLIEGVAWYISEAIKGLKGKRPSDTIHPED